MPPLVVKKRWVEIIPAEVSSLDTDSQGRVRPICEDSGEAPEDWEEIASLPTRNALLEVVWWDTDR